MTRPPLILVSADIESKGKEFADLSLSLSASYQRALMAAGGLPFILPMTISPELIAESVRRCHGVLLTGGDDVNPGLYTKTMPAGLRQRVAVTPDGGHRDLRELLLIQEALRQRKPLLAICRGLQILNVALGGTLLADIPTQRPQALNHRRTDRRNEVVHEVRLTPDSLLAKITKVQKMGVNSTHHQAVGRIAPSLRVTALSPDGMVEGLEWKLLTASRLTFLVGVQFHPERLADRYPAHRAIFEAFVQAC